jgi:hypothetical protein
MLYVGQKAGYSAVYCVHVSSVRTEASPLPQQSLARPSDSGHHLVQHSLERRLLCECWATSSRLRAFLSITEE